MKFSYPVCLALLFLLFTCSETQDMAKSTTSSFHVPYEEFTLDNGLKVIFHIDKSDPVVAIDLTVHAGSGREKKGRTGFAHLFEHLIFLESENLGKGGLDRLSARVGGSGAEGSTHRDFTNYYQVIPKDALEKMLWAEADKLGFFINTVNKPVVETEKQVVKNEKRQRVDNEPYGHTSFVVLGNLYPDGHCYSWDVIGSLEDLQNSTLDDVKEFYQKWYVPNNTTLVLAGDFDAGLAKKWVEKYFGEIKRGPEPEPVKETPAVLTQSKKFVHEDRFANLPELTIVWPAVPALHPDSYALEVLAAYLSEGKKAPFYTAVVKEKQLAPKVSFYLDDAEAAGEMWLSCRGFENSDLNQIHETVFDVMQKFETAGIPDADLARIKAQLEVRFYNRLSSVIGKANFLAQCNTLGGDPAYINRRVSNIRAIAGDDVLRVYREYIKGKPFVETSFVPTGKIALAIKDSRKAPIVEEEVVQGAEEQFDRNVAVDYPKTTSSFDRTVEPPYGEAPLIKTPSVSKDLLGNGLRVFSVETDEVPMVYFRAKVKGGLRSDDISKPGVANLFASLLFRGTKTKTAEQLEEEFQKLGAQITSYAGEEDITIAGSTLAKNYQQTMELLTEMVMQPRWDEEEFSLLKKQVVNEIQNNLADPVEYTWLEFRKLAYGKNHVFSHSVQGNVTSVNDISMEDVKNYYRNKFSPSMASFLVVGDVSHLGVISSLTGLREWKAFDVTMPVLPEVKPPVKSKLFFHDRPGSKQSVFVFGYPSIPATHSDYYPAQVMNYILGGGGFASRLLHEVREEKGYTYGIDSRFVGGRETGLFRVVSTVRTNVTQEAATLVKDILRDYKSTFSEQDLQTTISSLSKSGARAFEAPGSKIEMLQNISSYGWPDNYLEQRQEIIAKMTVEKIRALAEKYVDPEKMYYVILGDGETQRERVRQLGIQEERVKMWWLSRWKILITVFGFPLI